MYPSISLITLSRDNPSELAKTVKSVSLQSVLPDIYVVLDSSAETVAPYMRQIAESSGAIYMWTPPEGIYAAMAQSINLIPSDSYSWWINSSDWLAGRNSIELVKQEIASHHVPPAWVVGQLIRLGRQSWTYHDSGASGKDLLSRMRTGRSGFPHPATVFWTAHLKKVEPYGDRMSIASDYATALRFGRRFGPPLMTSAVLSLHVPNGISVQRPLINVLEKSRARLKTNENFMRIAEPFFLLGNILRGTIQKIRGKPGGTLRSSMNAGILGKNRHFCAEGEDMDWPGCCNRALEHDDSDA